MVTIIMTASFASSILFIFCIKCISLITGISRLSQVLNFLTTKQLSVNIIIYSDSIDHDELLKDTKSIQISLMQPMNNGVVLHENLTKYFEDNEIDVFTTVFDTESLLAASTSIMQISIVLRNKTLNTIQSRRMPQYIIMWPSDSEFLTYWEIMKEDNKEILSAFSARSQLYIIQFPTTASSDLTIYEFYSLPDSNDNFVNIVNEVPIEHFGIIGLTRSDFHGAIIKATAPEKNLTQGEVVFKESTDSVEFQGGFGVDIFNSFKISLNFNSKVIPTTYWASQYPNGSWYGMAKEIIDNTADIAVAKTSILLYRMKDLGYLAPTHALGVYAFFEQPSANTVRNIFFGPFSTNLWYLTFITYIGIIILIMTIIFVKIKLLQQSFDYNDHFLIYDSSIWTIATFCQQGWHIAPISTSLRIIFLCGVFLGLILYIAYSATLISLFSTKTIAIKSLEDLLHSQIHLSVDKNNRGAAALVARTNATDSSNQQYSASATLLKEKFGTPTNSNYVDTKGGISLMLAGHTAFLTFKDAFYSTTRNTYKSITDATLCKKVSSVPVLDSKFMSGLFVAKNSPYKEFFNIKITTMYTSGLMFRYVADYEHTYTPICNTEFESVLNIGVEENDVYPAYVLIVCGIFGSLLLLLLEYIIYHWNCKRFLANHDNVFHLDIKPLLR